MRIVLVVGLSVLATIAHADPPARAAQGNADDCARARKLGKQCVLDMGHETIEGAGAKHEGDRFSARDYAFLTSLIQLRRDFLPELVKSTEDL